MKLRLLSPGELPRDVIVGGNGNRPASHKNDYDKSAQSGIPETGTHPSHEHKSCSNPQDLANQYLADD
jgi:hypothetical protein